MNLNHLSYFVELAKLEHYTRAAERLSITQPSLSHAISVMEKDLGVKLFEKRGRNVSLTAYGREFYPYAKKALETVKDGVETVQKLSCSNRPALRVAYIYTLGSSYIPKLIRSFREQYGEEEIAFDFTVGNTQDVIRGLKEKRYDVGFCSRIPAETGIRFVPVAKEELVVVVPAGHALAGKREISLAETVPYPQIYYTETSGLRPIINYMYESIGAKPNIAYQIEEDSAMAGLVAGGFGIAVMPSIPLLKQLPVATLRITDPQIERSIYLACLKNQRQTKAGEAFVRYASRSAAMVTMADSETP